MLQTLIQECHALRILSIEPRKSSNGYDFRRTADAEIRILKRASSTNPLVKIELVRKVAFDRADGDIAPKWKIDQKATCFPGEWVVEPSRRWFICDANDDDMDGDDMEDVGRAFIKAWRSNTGALKDVRIRSLHTNLGPPGQAIIRELSERDGIPEAVTLDFIEFHPDDWTPKDFVNALNLAHKVTRHLRLTPEAVHFASNSIELTPMLTAIIADGTAINSLRQLETFTAHVWAEDWPRPCKRWSIPEVGSAGAVLQEQDVASWEDSSSYGNLRRFTLSLICIEDAVSDIEAYTGPFIKPFLSRLAQYLLKLCGPLCLFNIVMRPDPWTHRSENPRSLQLLSATVTNLLRSEVAAIINMVRAKRPVGWSKEPRNSGVRVACDNRSSDRTRSVDDESLQSGTGAGMDTAAT